MKSAGKTTPFTTWQKTTIPDSKAEFMTDNQPVQSQILKCSGYHIGRGFVSQEWRRSVDKRFITRFEM